MIVGNGLIASLFVNTDRDDVIFYASGVSNSLETNPAQFLREENLIRETLASNPGRLFIYFSTCSIYDSSKTGSDYVLHKLKMEQIIKHEAAKWLILRVSNAVGKGGNPNLLMNYLTNAVLAEAEINVHTNATRNLIDARDVQQLTLNLIDSNSYSRIVNIAYTHNYSVIEILQVLEKFYDRRLKLNLIRSGSGYTIDIPEASAYFRQKNLLGKENYLLQMLESYYN